MHNINSRLNKLLYRIAGEKHKDLVCIALAWKPVVGEILVNRSKIIKYENHILYIKTINHVWLQEFVVNKPDILAKLRIKTELKIKNILFTI